MSYEQALSFDFTVASRKANDFGRRPFIFTPNYQLGLGKGFEIGTKLLPIRITSYGANLYFKYSGKIWSSFAFGLVLVGGYAEANGDNGRDHEFFSSGDYYSYKNSIISSWNTYLPITVPGKYLTFTIAPNIGNYRARLHYIYTADYGKWEQYGIRDIDNDVTTNYFVPGVSTMISLNLPSATFISVELSTIRIDNAVVGFYGVAVGGRWLSF